MSFTFTATGSSAEAPYGPEGRPLEGGMYDAQFVGIEDKTIPSSQFDPEVREWAFLLLDDDGEALQAFDKDGDIKYKDGDPVEVVANGLTSRSLNVRSKTQPKGLRWLKSLLTKDEYEDFVKYAESNGTEGSVVTSDDLQNRKAQVEVAIKDNGWPAVVNVLPPRTRRSTRRATSDDAE